jgi:hypothetical protein
MKPALVAVLCWIIPILIITPIFDFIGLHALGVCVALVVIGILFMALGDGTAKTKPRK